jgi:hypothetical protein
VVKMTLLTSVGNILQLVVTNTSRKVGR